MLVRFSLDEDGRALVARSQAELKAVMVRKGQIRESKYIARTAALVGKARAELHKHRENNIMLFRMRGARETASRHADKQRRLSMKGTVQPARESIFEPMVFALKRLEPRNEPRLFGASQSRVLMHVKASRRKLNRDLPPVKKE